MSLDARAVAVNSNNMGDTLVGSHASGSTILQLDDAYDFADTGQVSIDGTVYTYSAMDDVANTITLTTTTIATYDAGQVVEAYPPAPVRYATIQFSPDDEGTDALVPLHFADLMPEGIYPEGIPVEVEQGSFGLFDFKVINTPGVAGVRDASTVPIVTSTAGGERVVIDGDGISLYTNDVVQLSAWSTLDDAAGYISGIACDSTNHAFVSTGGNIRKYAVATGVEMVGSGFPIATGTSLGYIAVSAAGYIYGVPSEGAASPTIRKFSSAGVEVTTGGWPAALGANTSNQGIAVNSVNEVFVAQDDDTPNILHKFSSAGVEVTTGNFPLNVGFRPRQVAIDAAGYVYVANVDTGDVHKFSSAGVEVTTGGWPATGLGGAFGVAIGLNGEVIATGTGPGTDLQFYDASGVVIGELATGMGCIAVAADIDGNALGWNPDLNLVVRYARPQITIPSAELLSASGTIRAKQISTKDIEVNTIHSNYGIAIPSPVKMSGTLAAPLKMQCGTKTITPSAVNVATSAVITFPVPFATTPKITATVNSSSNDDMQARTTAASTTGFTLWLKSSTVTARGLTWIAIAS